MLAHCMVHYEQRCDFAGTLNQVQSSTGKGIRSGEERGELTA
jgi:hypothetical protein